MIMTLWFAFLDWVYHAGYSGITVALIIEGLGVPFPGDAVLAFYGYMVSQGHFSYPLAILGASFGAWLGSLVSFAIGRSYGVGFLTRFGRWMLLQPKHIRLTEKLSDRYGVWVLLIGRFFPGVRTLSSYFAGIGGMSWLQFILTSLIGFAIWCIAWLSIGVWFGEHVDLLLSKINQLLLFVVFAALTGSLVWIWHHRRNT